MPRLPILTTVIVATSALAGCISPADYTARLQEIDRTTPTCAGESDCVAKWELAQIWIVKHAGYRVQTVTTVVIETFNSTGSSDRLAATVTKEPLGGGRYKIIAKFWCANSPWCINERLDATVAFNRYVNEAKP